MTAECCYTHRKAIPNADPNDEFNIYDYLMLIKYVDYFCRGKTPAG